MIHFSSKILIFHQNFSIWRPKFTLPSRVLWVTRCQDGHIQGGFAIDLDPNNTNSRGIQFDWNPKIGNGPNWKWIGTKDSDTYVEELEKNPTKVSFKCGGKCGKCVPTGLIYIIPSEITTEIQSECHFGPLGVA